MGFDASGNPAVLQAFGTWRGTWATPGTYNAGDIVQDGAAGANTTNYYYCVTTHTAGTWATDLAAGKWVLAINIAAITSAQSAAASSASAAATSATASAAASKLTAEDVSGTTYTLVLADANKLKNFTNASAATVTIPPNSSVAFDVGTQIAFRQDNAANQLTFAPGSGVTINSKYGRLKTENARYAMVYAVKIATDVWQLTGDMSN